MPSRGITGTSQWWHTLQWCHMGILHHWQLDCLLNNNKKDIKAPHSWSFCEENPGGTLPLWESVGMRRGFAPHFRHLDDLFAPPNLTLCTILFRSCWVPFRSPPFSACRRSFCLQIWPNLSFYSDLVGSHFELRAVHPYWFWPGVHPPPPPPSGENLPLIGLPSQRGRDTKKFPCHDTIMHVHDDAIKWKHFRLTGPLWGEFTGHRWIPLTKASDAELWCFLWSVSE